MGTTPKPKPSEDPTIVRIEKEKIEAEKEKKAAAAKAKANAAKQVVNGPKPSPAVEPAPIAPSSVKTKPTYRSNKPSNSTIANQKTDAAIAVGKANVAANAYENNPNANTRATYNKAKTVAASKIKNILRYSDGTLFDIFVNTPEGQFLTPEQITFVQEQGWDKDYKKNVTDVNAPKQGEYAQDYVTGEHVVTHANGSKTTTLPTGETYEYSPNGSVIKATDATGKPTSTKTAPKLPLDVTGAGASNGTFVRGVDSQGNVYYTWNKNSATEMPVVLLGDTNGSIMRTQFGTPFSQASLDANGKPTGNIDPSSPMTQNEAFNRIIRQIEDQPDGVRKFKQLLIAKNLIPPSSVNRTMADPTSLDKITTDAISYLITATTNHNVVLHDMNKPNQKFMSVNDYLNNMPALSVSTTETNAVHQKIQPKDYELNIDQMFQNILGRGATADELKHFTNQLQSYANANPQVTTKTTTETANGSNASTSVSGGLSDQSAAAMMRDEALKNPEAENYTKGSKFFNWFQEAIGSPVQLGG